MTAAMPDRANARLIAAAPEMWIALTEAEACMSIVEPRSDKAEYLRILGVVRAALAKAEGGWPMRGLVEQPHSPPANPEGESSLRQGSGDTTNAETQPAGDTSDVPRAALAEARR